LTPFLTSYEILPRNYPAPVSSSFSQIVKNSPCSFQQVFDETFIPFQLPLSGAEGVSEFHSTLFRRVSNDPIGSCISTFLLHPFSESFTSEMFLHGRMQAILDVLSAGCSGIVIFQNQTDPSSRATLRPDVVLMIRDALVGKFEYKPRPDQFGEAKTELTHKLIKPAVDLFPQNAGASIGMAIAGSLASVGPLFWQQDVKKFGFSERSSFNLTNTAERVRFIAFIGRLVAWIETVQGPTQAFHLPPATKVQTSNGHFITWYGDHLIKHLCNFSDDQINLMRAVHGLGLPSIERANMHEKTGEKTYEVRITRVGIPLANAVRNRLISLEDAERQVRRAVADLHEAGYAHNDLHMGNFFWDSDGVFLDDLEYLSLVDEPVPESRREREVHEPPFESARQRDEWQLRGLLVHMRALAM
jgi:hypothetical protein